MRQVVLDTETTGLEPEQGHRVIEIGCVELVNRRLTRRHFHQYLNPERAIDPGAMEVHGITDEFVANKPLFAQVADEFWNFIEGAELVIHNAAFDVGFLNAEFARLKRPAVERGCKILDTLALARHKHPGQRNSLDALCKRYGVDNSQRELHGALLDAEILAEVYLLMTGGQTALAFGSESSEQRSAGEAPLPRRQQRPRALPVLTASEDELQLHRAKLDSLARAAGGTSLWQRLESNGDHDHQ